MEGKYSEPATYGPSQEELGDSEFAIEGMIGSETAEIFDVGVGDRLIFITGFGAEERQITIELTAIIDPIDPGEEYWFLDTDIFTLPTGQGKIAPILIPEQTLFEAVARLFPATKATYN